MKELAATASGETPAPRAQAFALLADLEGYPRWYPRHVHSAEVLERDADGEPTRVKTTLHGGIGPIAGNFRIHMSVALQPGARVELRRLPKSADDEEQMNVIWRLADAAGPGTASGTRIEVAVDARLSIPRLVPVGGAAESFARGFLNAALEALSP